MSALATLNINLNELAVLLSILLRLSVILFMLPIFTYGQIPNNLKVGLILSLTLMIYPLVSQDMKPIPLSPLPLSSVVVGEVVFGILFSLSMLLIMTAFQFAGELIGFETGLGFAQVADPSGRQETVLGVWTQLLAIMVFFSLNGHLVVLRLIIESFKTVPVGSFELDAAIFGKMLHLSGLLFVLAVKLAAPFMAVLILVQVGLGLLSKFAPQINILATSFPITITIGIFFMGLMVAVWGEMAGKSFAELFIFLRNFTR